jgi:mannobiose 2-epimerase
MIEERELEEKIISYYTRLIDHDYGGVYGRVDHEQNVYKRVPKVMFQQCRYLWFFSEMGQKQSADDLFRFISDHGIDKEHGGLYWSLSYMGKEMENDSKDALCQATAILAFVSYGEITQALSLFHLLEDKFFDGTGYKESLDRSFSKVLSSYRLVSSLLHIIESYTELFKKTEQSEVRRVLERDITLIHDLFYQKEGVVLHDLLDGKNSAMNVPRSYGHEMECFHIVDKACEAIGMPLPAWTLDLYQSCLQHGLFKDHIIYSVKKREAVHWVEAEAVIAAIHAYARTKETKYIDLAKTLLDFIQHNLIMKDGEGEWYYDDTGNPKDIVSLWKGPYNNTSMYQTIKETNELHL